MGTQKISPAPGGGKTRSAMKGGDPRIGIGGMTKGSTLQRFTGNPLKSGGTMEQRFADSDSGGMGGPRSGKAPKPERVTSTTDDAQEARQGGGD